MQIHQWQAAIERFPIEGEGTNAYISASILVGDRDWMTGRISEHPTRTDLIVLQMLSRTVGGIHNAGHPIIIDVNAIVAVRRITEN